MSLVNLKMLVGGDVSAMAAPRCNYDSSFLLYGSCNVPGHALVQHALATASRAELDRIHTELLTELPPLLGSLVAG
jgi:hypothetical protein